MTTAFQSDAFQSNAFQIDVGPVPVIDVDTHDGDRQKRRWDKERADRAARHNDLMAAYSLLAEGRPAVAAELVEDFTKPAALEAVQASIPPKRADVDWRGLLDRTEAIERLWAAFLEMDDEEVLLLS